ncbi:MAG: Fic family protein [Pseudonocardia sp.]
MSRDAVDRWTEVEPLPPVNGDLEQLLASVDALRAAWEEALVSVAPAEFTEARRRSLRRHAIETGIIERLYDVDWGITEALVAEGLTADVAAREGGLDSDALAIIQSQHEALEFLAEAVRDGQDLTLHFIRQLHHLVCREQITYSARDQLGRALQVPLRHGGWKQHANHVTRQDGSLLEYTPPEHVQSQMERLLELYAATTDAHPVVRAAWLHHRFIRIHPFEDGNGRVGRALTLLVLLRTRYAPLVVDRTMRADYIDALDEANTGNLRALVRLFSRLEIVALRSELERPVEPAIEGAGVIDVARAYAERLRTLRDADRADRTIRADELATVLHGRITARLTELGEGIRYQFASVDDQARAKVIAAAPPDDTSRYWHAQLVRTAREVDFYTNLTSGSWWARLQLTVLGATLRYVAAVQKVGHGDTGVLAVTAFAESPPPRDADGEDRSLPTPILRSTPNDSVTLVFSDEPGARWEEIRELLDRTLAAAVARFAQQLG